LKRRGKKKERKKKKFRKTVFTPAKVWFGARKRGGRASSIRTDRLHLTVGRGGGMREGERGRKESSEWVSSERHKGSQSNTL